MAYNKVILQGNLVRDWEVRYTQSGTAVASNGIAVSHKYKTQAGEQREETLFVDLTAFGRTGEIANQYTRKGSKVMVDGKLKLDQWEDKNGGGKRSKHTVTIETFQMLDSKPDSQQASPQYQQEGYATGGGVNNPSPQPQYQQQAAPQPQPQQGHQVMPLVEDDQIIPF